MEKEVTLAALEEIITRAEAGEGCSREEALSLVELDLKALMEGADRIRCAHFGNRVELCSIINAKCGDCDMDCAFCSQSKRASTRIETYPFIEAEELREQMKRILADGLRRCSVVTSGGRLRPEELERLLDAAREAGPAPLCASLGRLRREELEQLKAAGVRRFHHNLETSQAFYPRICSTQRWEQRLETVRAAIEAGMDVCSGGLFGLGESWEDRIDLALVLRDLGVDSVPINFLYAHPGTPLADQPPLSADEALRIVAIYRFLLPKMTLRICGGRAHVLGDRQRELFAAGANGIMTGDYLTVSGSQYEADLAMLRKQGLEPVRYENAATSAVTE